ncbi:MAG: glutamyl-tRNA reductase [Bdellovibrionales bacterium]|nr:glutamyl-tRNA reductase [Bdellovibrionales bacterium]
MADLDSLFCWSFSAREEIAASIREKASLPEEQVQRLLLECRQKHPEASLFYVGTCHRVEVYGAGMDPADVLSLWAQIRGPGFAPYARFHGGLEALRHLIRVASSLESEVLGETQIMGQVRDAATKAREGGHLRGTLDWALQQALRAAKKIRSSTSLGQGLVSVAHVAVDGLSDVFDDLSNKPALVVGAGSMALQAIQRLHRNGLGNITWINRSPEKILAHSLASQCRLDSYERLHDLVWQHPVIVLATRSPEPIVTLGTLRAASRRRDLTLAPGPRVILDLGLPRNADENIHGYKGFYVRNVDEFSNRAEANASERRKTLDQALAILDAELQTIAQAAEIKARGPLLAELEGVLESLKNLGQPQNELENSGQLEYMSRALNAKLLHRLIEELNQVGEPLSSQVLGVLVRAWRQPEQWLKNDPQLKNPPENPPSKLVRIR